MSEIDGKVVTISGPLFKTLAGSSATMAGVSHVISFGLGSFITAGSKAADYFPHDVEGLLHNLRFRNRTAEIAQKRSRWFGGRFYNYFSAEHPDYIPISGTHLRQALNAAGIEPPEFIVKSGKYELRLDVSQKAVQQLAELQAQSTP